MHVRKQQQPTLFKLLVVVVVVVWWHWLFCCALLVYWPSGLYYASERICACSNCQTSPHDCSALHYYVAHQQNIRENAFPKVCPEKSVLASSHGPIDRLSYLPGYGAAQDLFWLGERVQEVPAAAEN